MPVLACGSNAFKQLSASDDLVIATPVELHTAPNDLLAASWSQTLLSTSGGLITTLGLPLGRLSTPTEPVRRWLGQEQFVAALLKDGRLERLSDGAQTEGRYVLAEMNGRGELLVAPDNGHNELQLYSNLDSIFELSAASVPLRLRIGSDTLSDQLPAPNEASTSAACPPLIEHITSISAGAAHFVMLSSRQQVYTWGDSRYGQAGPFSSSGSRPADQPDSERPAHALNDLSFFDGLFPISISCGAFHSAVVTRDGAAYLFGSDKEGQCGGADAGGEPQMLELEAGAAEEDVHELEASEIVQVACGAGHTFVRTREGQIWCAGANSDGQLGLGDLNPRPGFVRHLPLEDLVQARHSRLINVTCSRASTYFTLEPEVA
ncbi:hypothetical protein JCM10908_007242 [Rhodotorula pacifica]|uniref:uncharacterized protein n=1 Tax=Rhodotorula pacifica TaxID=1495444 RepID=UPI003179D079